MRCGLEGQWRVDEASHRGDVPTVVEPIGRVSQCRDSTTFLLPCSSGYQFSRCRSEASSLPILEWSGGFSAADHQQSTFDALLYQYIGVPEGDQSYYGPTLPWQSCHHILGDGHRDQCSNRRGLRGPEDCGINGKTVTLPPWPCRSPVATVVTVVSAATNRNLVTALGRSEQAISSCGRGRECRPQSHSVEKQGVRQRTGYTTEAAGRSDGSRSRGEGSAG